MATDRQIAANRLNSQKSTGPRTETGKAASRMNALKSGIHAAAHTVRGEDPAALAELTAEYYAEFHPVTPRQRDLVDTVVHNEWLIRRLRLTESDLYAHHFQRHDDNFDPKYRHRVLAREHPLSDSFESLEKRLLRLQSRLNSLERSTRAALKELKELKESTTSEEIGFVPPNSVEQASTLATPAFEPACPEDAASPTSHSRPCAPPPSATPRHTPLTPQSTRPSPSSESPNALSV
jgi:hypothetical protein